MQTASPKLKGRCYKSVNQEQPTGPTKAKLIYFHGFSDHIGHSAELFPTLANAGIEVHGMDQRGFGRSVKDPSERGDTGGTVQVMADMTSIIKSKLPTNLPLFIAGHSMGGGQVLYYAANGPKDVLSQLSGILSIAPWVALDPKVEPWSITVSVGRLAARLLPRFKIKNKLDPSVISRDPASNKLWEQDPLCHDTGTLQMFDGCLTRAQELQTGKALPSPEVKSIWLGHGTGDRITSWEASEAYQRRANHKDLVFKLYPDAFHVRKCRPSPIAKRPGS